MLSARLLLHPGAWEDNHELSSSNGHTERRLPKAYPQQSRNVHLQILMEGPMVLGQSYVGVEKILLNRFLG